jgi:hypothetical protein
VSFLRPSSQILQHASQPVTDIPLHYYSICSFDHSTTTAKTSALEEASLNRQNS